jgi:cytochrome c-type biogenesis protein CcmH/NrfG
LEIDPDFADAHHMYGQLFMNAGRMPDALQAFKRAVELDSDFLEPRVNLATVLMRDGNLEAAL